MAGIDKTYTDSYKDYKEFKDWADNQFITFYSGYKVCVGWWVYEYKEEDFTEGEVPIMNSPTWLDAYLLQKCKVQFVIDRLESVYKMSTIERLLNVDFTATPSGDLQKNRKIVIKPCKRSSFPLHNKPYKYKGKSKWWLQADGNIWYHKETETWVHRDYGFMHPYNSSTAGITSVKALIRHLRKQYLPKGATFTLSGRYVGERYLVQIK